MQAQVSAFENAEAFFYKKEYQQASSFYRQVISNEYSIKKEVAIAKCRLVLMNNNELNLDENLKFLEEATAEEALPSVMNSICSYALLQVYFIKNNHNKSLALIKKLGTPNLQPIYLARFYALAAETARYTLNKELEKSYLNLFLNIMKKNNMQFIEPLKINNKKLTIEDAEGRLSILNFESNMGNYFQGTFIENVLLTKMKEGDFQIALNILEKNIIKNNDNILINNGINISNNKIRSRLIHLINDQPFEMRIGIILPNHKDRQKSNQDILRAISVFLASPAVNGVKYELFIAETNTDEGSLSVGAIKMIFDNYVHALIIPEGFKARNELLNFGQFFSMPIIFSEENLSYFSDLKNYNSIKMTSEKGRFRDYFEKSIVNMSKNKIEEKIFDAFILLRNMHYLANSSQNTELDKIIRSGRWKIEGASAYEAR